MQYALLFVIQLILLFIVSQRITSILFLLFFRATRSQKGSVLLLAFLFLPGVIIHEFAHYLMAKLLFVHAENMEFIPKVTEDRVKLGSVQIAHTDPIRRFLIGVAPLILGLFVLYSMFFMYFSPAFGLSPLWKRIIVILIAFEIGNTMFSSRRDLEGSLVFLIAVCIAVIVCVLFFQSVLVFLFHVIEHNISYVKTIDSILGISLGIDLLLFGSVYVVLKKLKRSS